MLVKVMDGRRAGFGSLLLNTGRHCQPTAVEPELGRQQGNQRLETPAVEAAAGAGSPALNVPAARVVLAAHGGVHLGIAVDGLGDRPPGLLVVVAEVDDQGRGAGLQKPREVGGVLDGGQGLLGSCRCSPPLE
ncbi:hypothetical protein ACFY4K_33180 [Streptomyces leeuwenhoekii]|uniref:hypothetical protein n=1 Tax=Streptomyces leeuwenhoekii TaxID=1437453 RepID=UPI0036C7A093